MVSMTSCGKFVERCWIQSQGKICYDSFAAAIGNESGGKLLNRTVYWFEELSETHWRAVRSFFADTTNRTMLKASYQGADYEAFQRGLVICEEQGTLDDMRAQALYNIWLRAFKIDTVPPLSGLELHAIACMQGIDICRGEDLACIQRFSSQYPFQDSPPETRKLEFLARSTFFLMSDVEKVYALPPIVIYSDEGSPYIPLAAALKSTEDGLLEALRAYPACPDVNAYFRNTDLRALNAAVPGLKQAFCQLIHEFFMGKRKIEGFGNAQSVLSLDSRTSPCKFTISELEILFDAGKLSLKDPAIAPCVVSALREVYFVDFVFQGKIKVPQVPELIVLAHHFRKGFEWIQENEDRIDVVDAIVLSLEAFGSVRTYKHTARSVTRFFKDSILLVRR